MPCKFDGGGGGLDTEKGLIFLTTPYNNVKSYLQYCHKIINDNLLLCLGIQLSFCLFCMIILFTK